MNKLLITRWKNWILTALYMNGKIGQLNFEPSDSGSILHNIYIGKVKNIVKNIDSAFVDIGDGQMCYYSLNQNRFHLNSTHGATDKLQVGDEIVVQVSKDAVKTKAPSLTSCISLTGKYCVLTFGKTQLGFSSKIHNDSWKEHIRPLLAEQKSRDFGLIIRTNAQYASDEAILEELQQLKNRYEKLMSDARCRTCFSLLYQSPPEYLTSIRDSYTSQLEAVITDIPELYDQILGWEGSSGCPVTLYEDRLLPLSKLYSLDTAISQALQKKVWLKSGGYLVIEPTEALVVIDVNTGKYSGKKTLQDTIMKINLEAAEEIGWQLRLRNLSGIIIVDFIDMESEEDRHRLLSQLEQIVSKDPVKTTVLGITKLNLVEITRKKIKKPVYEQILEEKYES